MGIPGYAFGSGQVGSTGLDVYDTFECFSSKICLYLPVGRQVSLKAKDDVTVIRGYAASRRLKVSRFIFVALVLPSSRC